MRPQPTLGVALGGGGVRGFAHLGVLGVLERERLAPQVVAGTSMGAIVAALYATLPSLQEVEARLHTFFENVGPHLLQLAEQSSSAPVALLSLNRLSLMDTATFHRFFDDLIPDISFSQTRIPVAVVAVDLLAGCEVVYTAGSLRRAVLGSAALPGIFPPIEHDGRLLVDGGWTSRIPVAAARALGATRVIAVEVSEAPPDGCDVVPAPTTGLGVVLRAGEISRNHLARLQARDADLVLAPPTGHILLHDVSSLLGCLRLGAETAQAHLAQVRRLMDGTGEPVPIDGALGTRPALS